MSCGLGIGGAVGWGKDREAIKVGPLVTKVLIGTYEFFLIYVEVILFP